MYIRMKNPYDATLMGISDDAWARLRSAVDRDCAEQQNSAPALERERWNKARSFAVRSSVDDLERVRAAAESLRNAYELALARESLHTSFGSQSLQISDTLHMMTRPLAPGERTVLDCLNRGDIVAASIATYTIPVVGKKEDILRTYLACAVPDITPEEISDAQRLEIIRGVAVRLAHQATLDRLTLLDARKRDGR